MAICGEGHDQITGMSPLVRISINIVVYFGKGNVKG